MLDTVETKKLRQVFEGNPNKIILSNLTDKTYIYKKTVIRKINLKQKDMYQIERFTEKQAFHENVEAYQLGQEIFNMFPSIYSQMNIFFDDRQIDYKVTKKGKILFNQRQNPEQISGKRISINGTAVLTNNRKKNYLLKEGTVIPPLVDLGIFTKDGKIVRSMYDKYKQINRFLELVEDVVKDYPGKEMRIIDFGCGKSYLTFILYYYLVEIKGYQVHVTGLDLKEDVIIRCNETAKNMVMKIFILKWGILTAIKQMSRLIWL